MVNTFLLEFESCYYLWENNSSLSVFWFFFGVEVFYSFVLLILDEIKKKVLNIIFKIIKKKKENNYFLFI